MDLSISRPIRIFALVAIMVAAGGGAMLMLSKGRQTAAPPVVVNHATAVARGTPAPAARPAAAAKHAAAARKAKGMRTAPPTSVGHASAAPRVEEAVGANGLPAVLNAALRKHPVVVVSVFDPQAQIDAIAYAEAKAGASDARVGFLGVDLLDDTVAAALTTSLPSGGLLPEPGVLIYRRPGTLVQQLDGFNDRAAVEQAAVASATAAPPAAAPAPAAPAPALPAAPPAAP